MLCLARSIILCTVVLVTTDLSVYIHSRLWYVAQFQNMSVSLILFQINKLRRVLVAFSWYDTSIGYCQGLNRLAAIALLFLDEEHAFWCLVTIVHHHLPQDYYDRSLLGSQADQVLNFPTYTPCTSSLPTLLQRVLKDILKERVPALTQHLANCE